MVSLYVTEIQTRWGMYHEFTMLTFNEGVGDAEQVRTMWALDEHLNKCAGLVTRDYFRGSDGRWLEHVIWSGLAELEASHRIEDEPAVAALFERFDSRSTSYLRAERIAPEILGIPAEDAASP